MNQPYREPLEHLTAELGKTEHPEFEDLHQDTRGALESDDHHAALAGHPNLRERLEGAVERYGATHPKLTRAAQNLLDVLNANGL